MKIPFYPLVALAIGIAVGFIAASKRPTPRAIQLQNEATKRSPLGFIVAESKVPGSMKVSVGLSSSFLSNPGDPIKIFANSISAPIIGTITYSYPILETPQFGDIIIVKLELSDGTNNTYIINNGEYKVIFENDKVLISYSSTNLPHNKRA